MSVGVVPSSSSSTSAVSDAAFVKEEFWSIFEEAGLADIADSLSLSSSRPQPQQQLAAAGRRGGGGAAVNAPFRPVREEGEHSSSSVSSAQLFMSPLRSFYSSSPSSSSLYPASLGYSPLASSASFTSTPASPSTLIMYDTSKRGQPFLSMPSIPLSSSVFSPASPSRPGAMFRSPLLPSGMSSLLQQSPAAAGAKSAFLPLYASPTVKQEAAPERLDEDDDVTQSSFPSLSSLSTQSASLPSVASAVSALSSSLSSAGTPSSSLPPFQSSLPASSSTVSNPLKRPLPAAASTSASVSAAPASPPSRSKRLKRAESNPSPPPPPASSSSSSTSSSSSAPAAAPHSAAAVAASLSSSASSGVRQHKGLRHFSLKVCEKVEQQGVTTYNNVADELVRDLAADPYLAEAEDEEDESTAAAASASTSDSASASALSASAAAAKKKGYDERCKNIRRRVYDALNVLMAMGIIVKEKKRITWIGLPGGVSQAVQRLSEDKRKREQRIKDKRAHLQELLVYVVALKNLKHRNAAIVSRQQQQQQQQPTAAAASASAPSPPSSAVSQLEQDQIPLRFVLIKTDASHVVHLSVSADQTALQCDVSGPFMLHDASELLSLMGLAEIDGFELPYLVPREICAFYPEKLIKRSQSASSATVNESTGGRLGPGTVSLGGVKKK